MPIETLADILVFVGVFAGVLWGAEILLERAVAVLGALARRLPRRHDHGPVVARRGAARPERP